MNIRPKIPIYQGGNTLDLDKWIQENQKYYNWYSKLYPNAQILQGNPLKQRQDNADFKQLSSSHHTTDDLRRSAYNNYLYTKDYDARQRDLIYWSDQQKGLDKLTDQQIVDLYNTQAKSIRDVREAPQIYNTKGYSGTNQIFRNMFHNRSVQGTNTPDYNIGYQENQDNIIGTSTWQRRMDRYENPFEKDTQEGQQNRTFYINIPGTDRQVKVYKKENGDLGLFPNSPSNPSSATPQEDLNKKPGGINSTETKDKESLWSKLGAGLKNVAPDLLDALRLAGNMHNNERVYNESLKAIIPNLQQTYNTHRQVVGDEATKQAYYRRAAQGQTRAAQPFTSDADRQVTYMNEAKRIGDELRAQGDLADNQEIRRTSDESNQHQWANTQRNTEVANNNTTEINKANAARHRLTAQKYSADWTNWDQFLLGKQAKLEQEKALNKQNERQLALLDMQEDMLGNTTLSDLKTAREKAYNDYINNTDKTKSDQLQKIFNEANIKYQKAYIQAQRDAINRYKLYSAKSGTKLTYKNNSDKYLYKTSRDIVEHFRKISKMTDDSRVRTLPKTVKLSSHPRKMQLGGVAPFTVYRPLGVGGESAVSTQTSDSINSKSSKDTAAKDKLDMIKELFKSIQGLPIDASKVYSQITGLLSKYKAFGEEMSTDDIASMYLSAMNQIIHLKYSQDAYNKAHAQAVANDALNEIAVGSNGELYVQNMETGEIKRTSSSSLKDLEGNWNPLNNSQLLTMRAHSPNLAFNDDIFNVVNNGIGLTKIAAQIKSMAAQLGSSTEKIEGITEVESKQVKAGLKILAGTDGTPDGHYQVTNNTKQQTQQIKAALNYIYTMLPKNYKTILNIHSNGQAESLITSFLTSQSDSVIEQTIIPLTGKASNKEKGDADKVQATFNDLLQRQQVGIPREFSIITKDENTKLYSFDSKYISGLPNVDSDMSIDQMLSKSNIGNILDSRLGITFGDQVINPDNLKDIMFSTGGGATLVTLPCKYENGHKVVNFAIKDDFDNAIKEVSKQIPVDWTNKNFTQALANKLKKKGLNSLLTGNMQLDPNMLGLFLVVEGYTTDRVKFNKNSKYIEKVSNPDKQLEDRLNQALSIKGPDGKIQKYNVDINDWRLGPLFEGGWDDIYHGSIFIPLNNDPISAQIGNSGLDRTEARQLASEYQNYQKLINAKNINSSQL